MAPSQPHLTLLDSCCSIAAQAPRYAGSAGGRQWLLLLFAADAAAAITAGALCCTAVCFPQNCLDVVVVEYEEDDTLPAAMLVKIRQASRQAMSMLHTGSNYSDDTCTACEWLRSSTSASQQPPGNQQTTGTGAHLLSLNILLIRSSMSKIAAQRRSSIS